MADARSVKWDSLNRKRQRIIFYDVLPFLLNSIQMEVSNKIAPRRASRRNT